MAFFNSKKTEDGFWNNGDGFWNNGNADGWFSAKDGKNDPDGWYELDISMLENIAGGAGQFDDFDTYRFWRDSNGVLREVR